jgi:hypothetical protein
LSLVATQQDFEPANPTEGASALYYAFSDGKVVGYEAMAETINLRLANLHQRFAPNGQKLLVVGSGWGWLVSLLVTDGYDAYGIDVSQYAHDKAVSLYPNLATRFVLANALTAAGIDAASAAAGLHGNPPRWDLLVTEDFLECCTDAEIAIALPLLRGRCRANLLHIVTVLDEWGQANGADQRVNWKTAAQWKALLSPPDVVCDALGVVL